MAGQQRLQDLKNGLLEGSENRTTSSPGIGSLAAEIVTSAITGGSGPSRMSESSGQTRCRGSCHPQAASRERHFLRAGNFPGRIHLEFVDVFDLSIIWFSVLGTHTPYM